MPVYTGQAPSIKISIDRKTIFNKTLSEKIDLEHVSQNEDLVQLKIQNIIGSNPGNGFIISNFKINGVEINPDFGSYQCASNDCTETYAMNGKHFTGNGEYSLEIPYYTLRGQITKNKDRFDIAGQHHTYCFFGASMTDYDFTQGIPPIYDKENYANLFMQQMGGINLSSSGQTNQEILESVYKYLKNNKADVCFVQLISPIARQVKDAKTKEIYRWSPHTNMNLDHVDQFTKSKLKSIQEYFVYLDTIPILALQMPEYQKLVAYAEERGSKIFFITYFLSEYNSMKQVIPNNMAPYFDIDPNTKYCQDNGYHATPEEQENYFQSLIDFIRKIT